MKNYPICVDLDGTLVGTDTLVEMMIQFVKRSPWSVWLLLKWILQGKATLKAELAHQVGIPVEHIPYHSELLDYLREEKQRGREIVLATASHQKVAQAVADHVGVFSRVVATDEKTNLKGASKAERLVALFGDKQFVYIGNDRADFAIWEHAHEGMVVNASRLTLLKARRLPHISRVFYRQAPWYVAAASALRWHQWVKNLLLFIPLMAAHEVADPGRRWAALIAFGAFCLAASATYIGNDLLDVWADRMHPSKRQRPFAAGQIMPQEGVLLALCLFAVSFALAALLSPIFLGWLLLYIAVTSAYSWWLKRLVLIDVLVLALLYVVRIFAGAAAAAIAVSGWLTIFSLFLFVSLALVKRYRELQVATQKENGGLPGRGYEVGDSQLIGHIGVATGYLSVLVLALYISSPQVLGLYSNPEVLWLLLPFAMYWIGRVWLITYRGHMRDDPILFAVTDKASLGVAVLSLFVVWMAI